MDDGEDGEDEDANNQSTGQHPMRTRILNKAARPGTWNQALAVGLPPLTPADQEERIAKAARIEEDAGTKAAEAFFLISFCLPFTLSV